VNVEIPYMQLVCSIITIVVSVCLAYGVIKTDAMLGHQKAIMLEERIHNNEKRDENLRKSINRDFKQLNTSLNIMRVDVGRIREAQVATNKVISSLDKTLIKFGESVVSLRIIIARYGERQIVAGGK